MTKYFAIHSCSSSTLGNKIQLPEKSPPQKIIIKPRQIIKSNSLKALECGKNRLTLMVGQMLRGKDYKFVSSPILELLAWVSIAWWKTKVSLAKGTRKLKPQNYGC